MLLVPLTISRYGLCRIFGFAVFVIFFTDEELLMSTSHVLTKQKEKLDESQSLTQTASSDPTTAPDPSIPSPPSSSSADKGNSEYLFLFNELSISSLMVFGGNTRLQTSLQITVHAF